MKSIMTEELSFYDNEGEEHSTLEGKNKEKEMRSQNEYI